MLRLHTLGTTFITDAKGLPLGGAATHRRTLALLALLASAGHGGLSRDKVIGVLWPESDDARARHSLTQALYAARRAVRADDLFILAGPNISLNPERLSSDIQEFDALVADGKLAEAVALYRGPFLDALFLADAGDFERWSAGERERMQRRMFDVLSSLADDAAKDGRTDDAVRWRRQLAAMSPLDSRVALELMRALVDSGDAAGALRHAQLHSTMLREELALAAHPDIAALAEEIRSSSSSTSPANIALAERPATVSGEPPVALGESTAAALPARRRVPPRALIGIATLFVIVIATLLWRRTATTPGPVRAHVQRVVVAPFRVSGSDASLSYLRDGLVELLSARLADDSVARSFDAGAVLRAAQRAGISSNGDIGHPAAAALARTLGAERVVVGSVVGSPARMVVSATMLRAADDSVMGQASVSGPADSLLSLLDRLAARLLVSEAGQEQVLSHYTTRSLPALKSFLAGQAAYRRDEYARALAQYDRAIRADSSFALAALYAATTADALHLTSAFRDAVAVAWASRADLTARDAALLVALAGPRYPAPSPGRELAAAWQRFADMAPQSSEAWYLLASRLLEDGPPAGIEDARARAAAALQRSLALRDVPPRAAALLRWTAGDSSMSHIAPMRTLAPEDLRAVAIAGQYGLRALDNAREALAQLRQRDGSAQERAEVVLGEHSLAMNTAHAPEVAAANERIRHTLSGSDAWLRMRVLDAIHGSADSALATSAVHTLSRWDPGTPMSRPVTSAGGLANACVVAQWTLWRGDTARVARTIEALRGAPVMHQPTVSASPAACAVLLDAWLAVVLRQGDARARVIHADSLAFTPQVAGDAASYAHLIVAKLLLSLGDTAAARRSLASAPYLSGWPRYARAAASLDSLLSDRATRERPRPRPSPTTPGGR